MSHNIAKADGIPSDDDSGKDRVLIFPDSLRGRQAPAARSTQQLDGSRTSQRVGHPTLRTTHRLEERVFATWTETKHRRQRKNTESTNSTWLGSQNKWNNTAYNLDLDTSRQESSKRREGFHKGHLAPNGVHNSGGHSADKPEPKLVGIRKRNTASDWTSGTSQAWHTRTTRERHKWHEQKN